MRFNSASFLLGLAALGNVPETLGRALPNNAVEIYKENLARAAPVRIAPVKEVPVVKPAGTTTNTGTKTGEDTAPARIGATDKTPDTSTSGSSTRIGAVDSGDITLWCRGGGCGGKSTVLLTPAEVTARGKKGLALAADPKQGKDYTAQEKANYGFSKVDDDEFAEFGGVEDSIPTLELDKKYGFQALKGWQKMEVHSNDNKHEAVLTTSVGRVTKDGKDYVAIVAHTRFARADSNRYQIDKSTGNNIEKDGEYVPAENAGTKAVPVAQLMHDAAKQTGKLDGPKPEKIFLVSENVINDEAVRDILAAHEALNKKGKANVMNKGAPGAEGDYFNLLAGNDNDYSWLNTVGRNPDTFKDYEIVSIETRDVQAKTMAITLAKKA